MHDLQIHTDPHFWQKIWGLFSKRNALACREYGVGNGGIEGIRKFKEAHVCSPLCESLKLKSITLTPSSTSATTTTANNNNNNNNVLSPFVPPLLKRLNSQTMISPVKEKEREKEKEKERDNHHKEEKKRRAFARSPSRLLSSLAGKLDNL